METINWAPLGGHCGWVGQTGRKCIDVCREMAPSERLVFRTLGNPRPLRVGWTYWLASNEWEYGGRGGAITSKVRLQKGCDFFLDLSCLLGRSAGSKVVSGSARCPHCTGLMSLPSSFISELGSGSSRVLKGLQLCEPLSQRHPASQPIDMGIIHLSC